MRQSFLITGAAGFIGYHFIKKIYQQYNDKVLIVGVDNVNNYYSTKLKLDRINDLKKNYKNFIFKKLNITNYKEMLKIFKKYKFDYVVNLAAQAGVRYSLEHPEKYVKSNICGFFNVLELSKKYNIRHLVFASSSSVYGEQKKYPFKEHYIVTNPTQLYAATKISNEVMAAAYANLYDMKITGLRYFTVYGPWGRPDMAIFLFLKNLLNKKKIDIFNNGNHFRDFTYIDDIVDGTFKISISKKKFLNKNFNIFNIGNNKPVKLSKLIYLMELITKKKFKKNFLNIQMGDVYKTYSDINKIQSVVNYKPKTNIKDGLIKFIEWYKKYYKK